MHDAVIRVAAPALAVSAAHGQRSGAGLDGSTGTGAGCRLAASCGSAGRSPSRSRADCSTRAGPASWRWSAPPARPPSPSPGSPGDGEEKEAGALLRGVLDAAEAFGHRLPEMYAGEQRAAGRTSAPHPTACRPAAVAAAVHMLAALAGVRPDVPARLVAARPMSGTPLGAVEFTGLRVDGQPFSVRVGRLGTAMIEEAAPGLQLGA